MQERPSLRATFPRPDQPGFFFRRAFLPPVLTPIHTLLILHPRIPYCFARFDQPCDTETLEGLTLEDLEPSQPPTPESPLPPTRAPNTGITHRNVTIHFEPPLTADSLCTLHTTSIRVYTHRVTGDLITIYIRHQPPP